MAALYMLLGVAGNAVRTGVTLGRLPPGASEDARAAAGEMLSGQTVIRSIFLPVRLFVGWSLFSLVLYYTCRIWKAGVGFRYVHILAAEVYAEGAILLGSAAALASVFLAAVPAVRWVPFGLDAVFPPAGFTTRYVLNSVNLFSAGYLGVLSIMISVMIGIARAKACVSVLLAWALSLFVNAAILHALLAEFSFGL